MLTYEEALNEYLETHEAPAQIEFIAMYRKYRKTMKDYRWENFTEYLNWFE